ncbi:transposable element Tc1 transposase [Trichonephila clavipes]|nr:transposable element Tc1 transposase [Trichonephila clavipes]
MSRRKIRGHYEQLSEFERGRIIGFKEADWAHRRIIRRMGRSDAAIKRCSLQRFLARSGWNHADRGCIVFSDESRFQLCPDDPRRCVWRRPGKRADPAFTTAGHTDPQTGVMVWGAISFDSQVSLVVIRGALLVQAYVSDILRAVLLPFPFAVPWPYFSARYRQITYGTCCYELSYSLSNTSLTSQIEHVWDMMGR